MEGHFGWLLAVWMDKTDGCGTNDSDGVCYVCSYFQVAWGQLFEILVLVDQSVNTNWHKIDFSASVYPCPQVFVSVVMWFQSVHYISEQVGSIGKLLGLLVLFMYFQS